MSEPRVGLNCPHCAMRASFRLMAQTRPASTPLFHCFAVCDYCARGVMVIIASKVGTRDPLGEQSGALDANVFHIGPVYPQQPPDQAPEHTPEPIADAFVEARRALNAGSWTGAAVCHRRVLELTTKHLDPDAPRMNLDERIERLARNHRITDDLKDWAQEIRLDGNVASHDDDPFTSEQAKEIDGYSEIFLQYVFTLPGRLNAKRLKQLLS